MPIQLALMLATLNFIPVIVAVAITLLGRYEERKQLAKLQQLLKD